MVKQDQIASHCQLTASNDDETAFDARLSVTSRYAPPHGVLDRPCCPPPVLPTAHAAHCPRYLSPTLPTASVLHLLPPPLPHCLLPACIASYRLLPTPFVAYTTHISPLAASASGPRSCSPLSAHTAHASCRLHHARAAHYPPLLSSTPRTCMPPLLPAPRTLMPPVSGLCTAHRAHPATYHLCLQTTFATPPSAHTVHASCRLHRACVCGPLPTSNVACIVHMHAAAYASASRSPTTHASCCLHHARVCGLLPTSIVAHTTHTHAHTFCLWIAHCARLLLLLAPRIPRRLPPPPPDCVCPRLLSPASWTRTPPTAPPPLDHLLLSR